MFPRLMLVTKHGRLILGQTAGEFIFRGITF